MCVCVCVCVVVGGGGTMYSCMEIPYSISYMNTITQDYFTVVCN